MFGARVWMWAGSLFSSEYAAASFANPEGDLEEAGEAGADEQAEGASCTNTR